MMFVVGSFFLVIAFWLGRRFPIATFIFLLYASSFFCGWLIGREISMEGWSDFFIWVFTVSVLSGFGFIFCFFERKQFFQIPNYCFFKRSAIALVLLLTPAFFINLYIVTESLSYVIYENVSITKFKNQGEAARLIRSWVDPRLVFYANLVSGLGLISLVFHFYYLSVNRLVLSIFHLMMSLNLPLVGLHGLSRASVVQFVLMYFCVYLYLYSALNRSIRKFFNRLLVFSGAGVFFIFWVITSHRFSRTSFYEIPDESLIDNKALYSIFDYFSQWISNGIAVLERFSLQDLWYGKSSLSLVDYLGKMMGLQVQSYVELRADTLGSYGSRFNGLVATLVYDFSFVGVPLFLALFFLAAMFVAPKGRGVNVYSVPAIGFMLSIPALFFSNNYLSNEIFFISGIFALSFFFFSKVRIIAS